MREYMALGEPHLSSPFQLPDRRSTIRVFARIIFGSPPAPRSWSFIREHSLPNATDVLPCRSFSLLNSPCSARTYEPLFSLCMLTAELVYSRVLFKPKISHAICYHMRTCKMHTSLRSGRPPDGTAPGGTKRVLTRGALHQNKIIN
jgi:hypothetical protein